MPSWATFVTLASPSPSASPCELLSASNYDASSFTNWRPARAADFTVKPPGRRAKNPFAFNDLTEIALKFGREPHQLYQRNARKGAEMRDCCTSPIPGAQRLEPLRALFSLRALRVKRAILERPGRCSFHAKLAEEKKGAKKKGGPQKCGFLVGDHLL